MKENPFDTQFPATLILGGESREGFDNLSHRLLPVAVFCIF